MHQNIKSVIKVAGRVKQSSYHDFSGDDGSIRVWLNKLSLAALSRLDSVPG